jgi:cyclase
MRNRALGRIAALAAFCALGPALAGETAEPFTLTEVQPGVFAAIARPGGDEAVGNAGFVVGSDAVLVVDGFATPEAAEKLLALVREKTPLPVRWLVVTHHHLDHWGGGSVFAKAGAVVVAQENARARMIARAQQAGSPDVAKRLGPGLPSLTYRDSLTLWLGDRRVDVFTKPGHTDGDSLISVPGANVLFGGDLLQYKTLPNLSDANTEAWIRTLDELAVRFPSAAWIPGHGPVARPLDMRPLRDYLSTLRLSVARGLREGKSAAAISAELLPRLQQMVRGWTWSEHVGGAVAQMERELTGTTKAPAATTPVR